MKAVCLFAKGDCWHGGGLFQSATQYWLNDGYGHAMHSSDARLQRTTAHPWHEQYGGECPGVCYIRLQRDGWQLRSTSARDPGARITLFEKRISNQWVLRKHAHSSSHAPQGRGCHHDTHELFNPRTQQSLPQEDWEWAEVDGGRLVWASGGCLHAARVGPSGLRAPAQLHDFRAMRFARIAAPY